MSQASLDRRNSSFGVELVAGMVGAEIVGLDLSAPQPDHVWSDIRDVVNTYGVAFFRDQTLTPQQQIDFTNRFGTLLPSDELPTVPGFPQVSMVLKEKEDRNNNGGSWHTDQPHREIPIMGTILLARENPPYGGDTLFLSMGAAYDALSEGLRKTLDGMRALHSDANIYATRAKNTVDQLRVTPKERSAKEVSHPVVVRHPDTGRKALYITWGRTVRFDGWTKEESAPLLNFLLQHVQKPEFACRFRWREGSLAFWDNRLVMHYATNDYHGFRREMHRTWVAGTHLG